MPDDETEQTQDAVRRLLAEARTDEPVPPDVAARLDTLLGRLVEERAGRAEQTSAVVSLDARRRRGRVTAFVLGAAAAVVVGALGLAQLPGGSSGEDSAASDSSGSSSQAGGSASSPQGAPEAAPAPGAAAAAAPLTLTSADFDADVRRELAEPPLTAAEPGAGEDDDLAVSPQDAQAPSLPLARLPGCRPREVGAGDLYPATYDGEPALLVVRAGADDTAERSVELYTCASPEPVRTTTLPAP